MICYLPSLPNSLEGYAAIAHLATETSALSFGKLELDLSRCAAFDPNMAAPLGAVLNRVTDRFNIVEVVNVLGSIESLLRRNRFLAAYGYTEETAVAILTTIPFRRMRLADDSEFQAYLIASLHGKGLLQMDQGTGHTVKQSIFEVFQNAVSHSGSKLGVFVCGQFFPTMQRLDFSLADAGVGIPKKVNSFLPEKLPEPAAIAWAFEDRNTTRTGRQPGGVGLKVVREFIEQNHGKIQIASGFGYFEFSKDGVSTSLLPDEYPGTVVTLQVSTLADQGTPPAKQVNLHEIF